MNDIKKRKPREQEQSRISALLLSDRMIKAKRELSENGYGRVKLIEIDNVKYEIVATFNDPL